jgi:transposase-like protein
MSVWVRYADGGGLSAQGRAKREAVRLQAAAWFAEDVPVGEIARRLRVSTNAVYVWRRRWRTGGQEALASKGPGGSACRLDETRVARLAAALEQGPHRRVLRPNRTQPRPRPAAFRRFKICSRSRLPCAGPLGGQQGHRQRSFESDRAKRPAPP